MAAHIVDIISSSKWPVNCFFTLEGNNLVWSKVANVSIAYDTLAELHETIG